MEYLIGVAVIIVVYCVIRSQIAKSIKAKRLRKYVGLFSEKFGTMVANRKIDIGMNKEILLQSWGKPQNIDGKVIKADYEKINYHYGKFENKAGYKYRIALVNDEITEIREN